jgi:hypothetical protein
VLEGSVPRPSIILSTHKAIDLLETEGSKRLLRLSAAIVNYKLMLSQFSSRAQALKAAPTGTKCVNGMVMAVH